MAQNAATVAAIPEIPQPVDFGPRIDALRDDVDRALKAILVHAEETRAIAAAIPTPAASPSAGILSAFNAIARILAVRALLFIALLGGFALAVMAMLQQSWVGLALVVCFVALSVGPLAWLEIVGRQKARGDAA